MYKDIRLRKLKPIVMYNGGYPESSKEFYEIKKKYNFFLIEDACHAFGLSIYTETSILKLVL